MVSAAAQVREAIVGWGNGLDCRVAGEDSKDLAAVRGEGERDHDNSQVPDQGPGDACAVDWSQGQKRSIHRPQCLCAGLQVITGSGHCCPADQENKLSVEMSPLPLSMAYLSSPSTSLAGKLQEAARVHRAQVCSLPGSKKQLPKWGWALLRATQHASCHRLGV